MRIAYFDLVSGISGDMTVGALIDLGLPRKKLQEELGKLAGVDFRIQIGSKALSGIRARRFNVIPGKKQKPRSWSDIRRLIEQSRLHPDVKTRALAIFLKLALAESKIHGTPTDAVHFHEVGAVDSIVDIVAAAFGTVHLGIEEFACSVIPLGRGLTGSQHGILPAPAPATLELLAGLTIQGVAISGENVTPTGAAILATFATECGEIPRMRVEKIGYGAGTKEFSDRPNVLRIVLGQSTRSLGHDQMIVIEANIDDMNPELYDYVLERLFEAGARDVTLSPIQMKKNRPGTLVRIIAEPALREDLAEILLAETSTIGVRYYSVDRMVLKRKSGNLKTKFGTVRVKLVEQPGGQTRATPEYDDLRRIAAVKNIPLKLLYDEVAVLARHSALGIRASGNRSRSLTPTLFLKKGEE